MPLDISKSMATKKCNIVTENMQNDSKIEVSTDKRNERLQERNKMQKGDSTNKINVSTVTPVNRQLPELPSQSEKSEENHYVEFEQIVGEKYSNPVLRNLNPARVVIDCTGPEVTTPEQEPGTTAV